MGCTTSTGRAGDKPTPESMTVSGTDSKSLASEGHFVVELVCASNVPDLDVGDPSDPFAIITLKDAMGGLCKNTKPLKWNFQKNCNDPVWRKAKDFGVNADDADTLRVELFDYDVCVFLLSFYLCADGLHGRAQRWRLFAYCGSKAPWPISARCKTFP